MEITQATLPLHLTSVFASSSDCAVRSTAAEVEKRAELVCVTEQGLQYRFSSDFPVTV